MSEKIKPHHLERKAILYVRQSSAYQVHNNLESQKLQYAMQERLYDLGVGARSRSWMRMWADPRRVRSPDPVSSAWSLRCAWDRWVR
jgi:hypothetical protein